MITQFYPSKRKPPEKPKTMHLGYQPHHTNYEIGDVMRAKNLGITTEEFNRRCFAVRSAWIACRLMAGDTVYPSSQEEYEKYGPLKVVGVCRDYRDMQDTDWPANNNPFIVTLVRIEGNPGETVFATNGWAIKDNKHLKIVALGSAPVIEEGC